MATYVLNQLRIGNTYQRRFIVSLNREGTTEAGIEIGRTIEQRGQPDARWVFVGQFDTDKPVSQGEMVDTMLAPYVDLGRFDQRLKAR